MLNNMDETQIGYIYTGGKDNCKHPRQTCYWWKDYMPFEVCIDCKWYKSEKKDKFKESK